MSQEAWRTMARQLLGDRSLVQSLVKQVFERTATMTPGEQDALKQALLAHTPELFSSRRPRDLLPKAPQILLGDRGIQRLLGDVNLALLRELARIWRKHHAADEAAFAVRLGCELGPNEGPPPVSMRELAQATEQLTSSERLTGKLVALSLLLDQGLLPRKPEAEIGPPEAEIGQTEAQVDRPEAAMAQAEPVAPAAFPRLSSLALRTAWQLIEYEPCNAPIWSEIPAFMEALGRLVEAKREEGLQVEFSTILSEMYDRWGGEMQMLGFPEQTPRRLRSVSEPGRARELLEALRAALQRQQELASRQDESLLMRRERLRALADLLDPMEQTARGLLALLSLAPLSALAAPPPVAPAPAAPAAPAPAGAAALAPSGPASDRTPPVEAAVSTPTEAQAALRGETFAPAPPLPEAHAPALRDQPGRAASTPVEPTSPLAFNPASRRQLSFERETLLCLDFGTARSKAFATRYEQGATRSLPLRLGDATGTGEQELYALASSLWVDDNEKIYFGQQAITMSLRQPTRLRCDSLKDYFSTVDLSIDDLLDPRLRTPGDDSDRMRQDTNRSEAKRINPFVEEHPLSFGDLLLLYLGFLTYAAEQSLRRQHGITGQVPRRFALPGWPPRHREKGISIMRSYLARAALVADAVGDRWSQGLPVAQARALAQAAFAVPDAELPATLLREGVSEPLAAAGTRVRRDDTYRGLVLVVDVGAGTTDVGLFLVNEDPGQDKFQFSEIKTRSEPWAGNKVDVLLANFAFQKLGSVGPLELDNLRREFSLRARNYKETLFNQGQATVSLSNGRYALTLQKQEFVEACAPFAATIERLLVHTLQEANDDSLASVPPGSERRGGLARYTTDGVLRLPVVLTGGGAVLPMIERLSTASLEIPTPDGPLRVLCQPTPLLPEQARTAGLQAHEYLPLAVAWGGSIPEIPTAGKPVVLAALTRTRGPRPDLLAQPSPGWQNDKS